jgi:hypothetical protein
MKRLYVLAGLALCTLGMLSGPAFALDAYDAPVVSCEGSTISSITLKVCGGALTGAPAGVTIQWKTATDFAATGWSDDGLCKLSLSGQPSLQHPDQSRWELLPGECETIKLGDIMFDETGVSGSGCGVSLLECGTDYVIRAFAHAGRGFGRSDWTADFTCSTLPCPATRCTYSWGYWQTHGGPAGCSTATVNAPDPNWPASVLSGGMNLGSLHYTAAQLCTILNTPAAGKGLIALAHQLIGAYLNLANAATSCGSLSAAITSANSAIGNVDLVALAAANCAGPPSTRPPICGGGGVPEPANTDLTAYNEGGLCSPNCHGSGLRSDGTTATEPRVWGLVKDLYR